VNPRTLSTWIDRILKRTAGYEFSSFVLGFARPDHYVREHHDAEFRQLKIAVGEELTRIWPDVEVDFERPELRIDFDAKDNIRLQAAPLYLGGRYRKLSRDIPAARWIHHRCRGNGCPSCRHSGNLCGPSIQELLAAPVLAHVRGSGTLFHSLGREDTDALMLDSGRPFVLEISSPRRRTLPVSELTRAVAASSLAEVIALRRVDWNAAQAVKAAAADKTYRAWLAVDGELPDDLEQRVQSLNGTLIHQLTPTRVMHRRGRDRLRKKRLYDSSWLGQINGRYVWELTVESGTYVKELVSGDDGRTRPSLSDLLGAPCRCQALDVLEIHWQPPWESTPCASST
jgi:tRNA pseudouridine synthase 10